MSRRQPDARGGDPEAVDRRRLTAFLARNPMNGEAREAGGLDEVPLARYDSVFRSNGGVMTKIFLAAVAACLTAVPALADASARFSIPGSEIVDLAASANGIEYQLYVHVPPGCTRESPCPAVYTLDAEYAFPITATIVAHLAERGRIPPLVTVSIGYPDKSHYRRDRSRDYTPYFHATGGYGEEMQRASGGGPAFLSVIRDEIIPHIEGRYPVAPDERTLVGHSYGGLFASYAWIAEPGLFANYIIVSPSLWYADGRPLADIADACQNAEFAEERDLYLAVGSYEEQPENGRPMVSDLQRMKTLLDQCAARRVSSLVRVFENETHASIFPAALSTGLRAHFQ